MNTGRHFGPPTPAIRPQDPFSNDRPRSAEVVPSCDAVIPPVFRPRPVRIDPSERTEGSGKDGHAGRYMEPKIFSDTTLPSTKARVLPRRGRKPTPPNYIEPESPKLEVLRPTIVHKEIQRSSFSRKKISIDHRLEKNTLRLQIDSGEENKKCEWEKCHKTFLVKVRGHAAIRRYCSATCRGRASEARTGKRALVKKKS